MQKNLFHLICKLNWSILLIGNNGLLVSLFVLLFSFNIHLLYYIYQKLVNIHENFSLFWNLKFSTTVFSRISDSIPFFFCYHRIFQWGPCGLITTINSPSIGNHSEGLPHQCIPIIVHSQCSSIDALGSGFIVSFSPKSLIFSSDCYSGIDKYSLKIVRFGRFSRLSLACIFVHQYLVYLYSHWRTGIYMLLLFLQYFYIILGCQKIDILMLSMEQMSRMFGRLKSYASDLWA